MSDVEGVHFVRIAKPGKPIRWYVYAWRGGPCILKADGPNKPKLDVAAIAKIAAAQTKQNAAPPDLLYAMIRDWQASPEWKALAKSTRDLWGGELDLIEAKWGKLPIALWNDFRMVAKVVAWRDSRAATPRAADQGVNVLAELLKFGKLRARVKLNVAADVPAIYRAADRAEIIWTEDDLARAEAAAKKLKRESAMDAIRLACLTAFRRADLAALTWDEVSETSIVRTALKKSRGRRRRAVVPVIPALTELLAELRNRPRKEGVNTVLVTKRGTPWQPASLTEAVIAIAKEANIVQPAIPALDAPEKRKHLHDCRGTFATHLCRAGLSNDEIARICAWSPESVERIRRTYVDDAAVVVALSERIRRVL